MKRIISTAMIVGLLALLGCVFFSELSEEKQDRELWSQLQHEAKNYEQEIAKQRKEIELLQASLDEYQGIPSVQLIFAGAKEEVYSEIYPFLSDKGYVGVLGLFEEQLPGDSGAISKSQYQELVNSGWSTCLLCDSYADYDEWYKRITEKLSLYGITAPSSIMFVNLDYTKAIDSKLTRDGFDVIIHQEENGYPAIVQQVDVPLWHIGAYDARVGWTSRDLKDLMRSGGNLVLLTAFETTIGHVYSKETFSEIISYIGEYTEEGSIAVTNLEDGKENCKEAENNKLKYEEQIEKKIDIINERIDGLQKEVDTIYNKWN